MALVPIISVYKHIELILLGGNYDRETATNTGVQTCGETDKYIADLYLMGTCAVQKDFGISAVFQTDSEAKRAMLKNAIKTYALGNKAVLNSVAHFKVCELKEITGLITELATDDHQLDQFRNRGIQLM